MEKLRKTVAVSQAKLDDPQLYARDPKAFEAASAALHTAEAALAAAENEWLELEILREEIGE